MKRWAILTVILYAIALLLLTAPVVLAAFANWGLHDTNPFGLRDLRQLYSQWGYWLWLGVLAAGQILLLLVPIDLSQKRLPARRKLKVPIVVTAFFLANLLVAGVLSLLCAVFKDNAFEMFTFVDRVGWTGPADQTQPFQPTVAGMWASMGLILILFWTAWALLFARFAKADDASSLIKRAVRWLLRGSILELIVAVPSHVIARRRDDCCAPVGTFWGIATGISVMLLCFGPGVYFLFVERFRRLQPKPATTSAP
jgi:hypothetical protein